MPFGGGEAERGAKRQANNAIENGDNPARTYFHARCASSITTAIIPTHHPNPFRNSLRSSQLPSSGPPWITQALWVINQPRRSCLDSHLSCSLPRGNGAWRTGGGRRRCGSLGGGERVREVFNMATDLEYTLCSLNTPPPPPTFPPTLPIMSVPTVSFLGALSRTMV